MNILHSKIDDVIACQQSDDTLDVHDTVSVLEQLIEYYQNVAAKLRNYALHYASIKKMAIEKTRRGSYEETMRRIN